jgi:hypothetical protein
MMYCVNCEYPVTRTEKTNRKCNNCGKDPSHEQKTKTETQERTAQKE